MKKIPKKNSFKTPPGYFEGLTERIQQRMQEEEAQQFPKEEGFAVPDTYFDNLEKEILASTTQNETPVIQLRSYKKYLYAAAAIAAIFVLVIALPWNRSQPITFDDLAEVDITSYFESRELELSSYEIAEVIPVANLEIDEFMETGMDDEQIMDYLEDTIDDLDELNIDLDEAYQ
ncbi:hypothetical protein [uncultured Muriicola sp.]|uniref:hypothetical protein n=1 Tax=uncultured Muriicola sp. TaxID=1583102 RepID=UPI0026131DFA|nr:hypothetical protein [uncultured Muriicola sp.]